MTIAAAGKYLMPGLAEMHAHVPPQAHDPQLIEDTLFLYVANGITTARSMLGAPHHLALRERASERGVVSPRIVTSGPSLNGNTVPTPAARGASARATRCAASHSSASISASRFFCARR